MSKIVILVTPTSPLAAETQEHGSPLFLTEQLISRLLCLSVMHSIGNAVFGSWLARKVLAKRTRNTSARLNIESDKAFN